MTRRTDQCAWTVSLLLTLILTSTVASARGSKGASSHGGAKASHVKASPKSTGTRAAARARKSAAPPHTKPAPAHRTPPASPTAPVARDERGRIQRSEAARHAFARQTGYPNGRPGYVIDHIKPLACGGADAPSNMQWQTAAAAKMKDKVERQHC